MKRHELHLYRCYRCTCLTRTPTRQSVGFPRRRRRSARTSSGKTLRRSRAFLSASKDSRGILLQSNSRWVKIIFFLGDNGNLPTVWWSPEWFRNSHQQDVKLLWFQKSGPNSPPLPETMPPPSWGAQGTREVGKKPKQNNCSTFLPTSSFSFFHQNYIYRF